jgi:hypothetical protein
LALRTAEAGFFQEALTAAEEEVRMWDRLTTFDRERFEPHLALA